MLSTVSRISLPSPRSPLVALAALAVAFAAPATASAERSPLAGSAAAGKGAVTLTIGGQGAAAKALAARGVKIGALAPAKRRGKRLTLPVQSLAVAKSATLALRGGVRFEAGMRVAKLRSIRVVLAAREARVSAKAGKRRLTILVAKLPKRKAKLDRSKATAKLTGAKAGLTRAGVRLLRGKLALSGLATGALGQLAIDAGPKGGNGNGGPGGGAGGGGPKSGPIRSEPPLMPRPSTAVDVSDVAIAWYPRDSWIRYLDTGATPDKPQNGFFVSGGATQGAPLTSSAHPCSDVAYGGTPSDTFDYAYDYAPKPGASWYDPPSQTAAIYGQGNVRFHWQSHGIDLTASDPEIELNPTAPRSIFRFSGDEDTDYQNERAVLTNLDLAGQPSVAGNTRTYTAVRGRLSEDGQAVFAGFYPPPGDGFGCLTVSLTTP